MLGKTTPKQKSRIFYLTSIGFSCREVSEITGLTKDVVERNAAPSRKRKTTKTR